MESAENNGKLHGYSIQIQSMGKQTERNFIEDILINHSFENLPASQVISIQFLIDGTFAASFHDIELLCMR